MSNLVTPKQLLSSNSYCRDTTRPLSESPAWELPRRPACSRAAVRGRLVDMGCWQSSAQPSFLQPSETSSSLTTLGSGLSLDPPTISHLERPCGSLQTNLPHPLTDQQQAPKPGTRLLQLFPTPGLFPIFLQTAPGWATPG